jgi:peptidoglycan LD-endopeptidase LytH
MRRAFGVVVLFAIAAAIFVWQLSPRERYGLLLHARGINGAAARAWSDAADLALGNPAPVALPLRVEGTFGENTGAIAWRIAARRGHRLTAHIVFGGAPVFLDLYQGDGKKLLSGATSLLVHDVDGDDDLILRAQPRLNDRGSWRLSLDARASLMFPVRGVEPQRVQSRFGDPRDAGARRHEGIDIFARRGTPVVAATDGWIAGSTRNGLGGNVVWVWSPLRDLRTYYAHLDRQAVQPGDRVRAGDVVGYVGNTGNARTTAPHLHFGVYVALGGAVDPLPYVCGPPCEGRRLHRR